MPQRKVQRIDDLSQAAHYVVVAGSVAVFYLLLFSLGLVAGWHYFLAILAAQVVTIAVAFPVYRTFVFKSRGRIGHDFLRFLTVWVGGAIAGILVTPLLVEVFQVHPLVAQIVSIGIISVASFLSHRFFSFRTLHAKQLPAEGSPPSSQQEGPS